jgi:hypothetical protein
VKSIWHDEGRSVTIRVILQPFSKEYKKLFMNIWGWSFKSRNPDPQQQKIPGEFTRREDWPQHTGFKRRDPAKDPPVVGAAISTGGNLYSARPANNPHDELKEPESLLE